MKITTQKLFALMILLYLFISVDSHATKWIINVQNFSFSPASLPLVHVGDTVRWVWINGSHTTTSTTIPASAPIWNSPITVSNQSFEYIPTILGTYNYKCIPHEGMGMVGSFIVSPLPFISLNLKVFLEGPFNSTVMNTILNSSGLLPLSQPYDGVAWNYTGTENVASIPNAGIVDWVLVELRETTGDATTAAADKRIHRQAAFLLSNGNIVGLNGSSLITYTGTITNNLYVIIWHRNHIGIMSSGALQGAGGIYTWDFTTQLSKAYLDGQKQLVTGIYGMIGGDVDASGNISVQDIDPGWSANAGEHGYLMGDINLNGQVNNPDKNDIWDINMGSSAPLLLNCGNPLIDVRDGQSYNTIQIGTQCWMSENLNLGTMIPGATEMADNSIVEKYCYNNNTANCDIYGGLYQWHEIMQYINTPGVQGLCPANWHLPTDAEWTALTTFLGGESIAGGKMKTTGTIEAGTGLWFSPNTGATNSSGFTSIPGGRRFYDGNLVNLGIGAFFWSSTEDGSGAAWYRAQYNTNASVERFNYSKVYGFSARCIKD